MAHGHFLSREAEAVMGGVEPSPRKPLSPWERVAERSEVG